MGGGGGAIHRRCPYQAPTRSHGSSRAWGEGGVSPPRERAPQWTHSLKQTNMANITYEARKTHAPPVQHHTRQAITTYVAKGMHAACRNFVPNKAFLKSARDGRTARYNTTPHKTICTSMRSLLQQHIKESNARTPDRKDALTVCQAYQDRRLPHPIHAEHVTTPYPNRQ